MREARLNLKISESAEGKTRYPLQGSEASRAVVRLKVKTGTHRRCPELDDFRVKHPSYKRYFLKKRFWNAKNDPILGRRGVVIVLPMLGKKKFRNAVPSCVLLRNNFRNGVPARSVTKNTPASYHVSSINDSKDKGKILREFPG
jgi:hypothetical protein